MHEKGKHIRKCRVCGLEFRTHNPKQKTCSKHRGRCLKKWRKIYEEMWRAKHPYYHRDYMRRYRRVGREVTHVQHGLAYYYADKHADALYHFEKAIKAFESATDLNKHERRDLEMCKRMVVDLRRYREFQP